MSIEWLLTKASDTEAQEKKLKRANEEGGPSDNVSGSKPRELNQETKNCKEERQHKDEYSSSAKTQNRHPEIDLRCDCGFEGTVTCDKMYPRLLEKDKKDFVYFECPNCKRHLQYNYLTGNIKTKKGIFRALLCKFS